MVESTIAALMMMVSVLIPSKGWYAPGQPIEITVKQDAGVSLVLTDFAGKPQETKADTRVAGGAKIDLSKIYPIVQTPGAYVLFAVPEGKKLSEFAGTPLVIEARADKRLGAPPGPMVVRVEPLRYAVMHTNQGDMTAIFYFDVAPNTAASFLSLAAEGYFDGLTFHRIVKEFVIQGGDPRGIGTGGPGYTIPAEFNERPHEEGALSMARSGDPNEGPGVLPRPQWADSAGSQFFICLNYQNTRQLDNRYTVFGKIVTGLDVVKKIASVDLAEGSEKPKDPQVINKMTIHPVTSTDNPYKDLLIK